MTNPTSSCNCRQDRTQRITVFLSIVLYPQPDILIPDLSGEFLSIRLSYLSNPFSWDRTHIVWRLSHLVMMDCPSTTDADSEAVPDHAPSFSIVVLLRTSYSAFRVGISYRHSGQIQLYCNHCTIQLAWYKCPHGVRVTMPHPHSSKQMAHTADFSAGSGALQLDSLSFPFST